jgi:hypothetical protein
MAIQSSNAHQPSHSQETLTESHILSSTHQKLAIHHHLISPRKSPDAANVATELTRELVMRRIHELKWLHQGHFPFHNCPLSTGGVGVGAGFPPLPSTDSQPVIFRYDCSSHSKVPTSEKIFTMKQAMA